MKLSELNKIKLAVFILLYAVCIGALVAILLKISGLAIGKYAPYIVGGIVGFTVPSLLRKFEKQLM